MFLNEVKLLKSVKRLLILAVCIFSFHLGVFTQHNVENVIVITLDGARNQEIFGGLDLDILKSVNKDALKSAVYKKYYAETATERREKLMPFFWQTLMKDHGSIAGNRSLKSEVKTTNKMFFSYPGYSEILTGQAHDDVIDSNSFGPNRFPSFLNFLQTKMKLGHDQVASFASWDVMKDIATNKPGAFMINAGYERYPSIDTSTAEISELQFKTLSPWSSVRFDYYTHKLAMAHLKKHRPRVLHIGFGETDDWAHDKNYERMVQALDLTDSYLKELWEYLQNDVQYKNKTSIIITVDHGRGNTAEDWHTHGQDVAEAQYIWMAFIDPNLKLRGEWKNSDTIRQDQIAGTLCRILNFDYAEQNPNAGKPISELF